MLRRAFTLVEMLVVVAIIALVISIIMPILGRTREEANQVICTSNLRQLMLGFTTFATAHDGHLPGGGWDATNSDPDKRDWLQGANPDVLSAAPEQGTIYQYVNSHKVYRCPSLRVLLNAGSGYSNGVFDYTAFICFSGAQVMALPHDARFTYPDGHTEIAPLPVIVEEDPGQYMNTGLWPDGGHCWNDRMASTHQGGANYASQDGSVHWFAMPAGTTTFNWYAMGPRRTWVQMCPYDATWGWWDRQ